MRTLKELLSRDSGWPVVKDLVAGASHPVEVLPVARKAGEAALLALQVTTRSLMGAVAYESGGLLIDHGWVRVLGGGSPRLPRALGAWNFPDSSSAARMPNAMLVADDVLGGFFAINGGAFGEAMGNVFYLAPDSLEWEDLGRGYGDFLAFLCGGDLERFYGDHRWRGWREEVASLPGDEAFSIYPLLFTRQEGGIEARSRRAVPIEDLWELHANELPKRLAGLPNGAEVVFAIED